MYRGQALSPDEFEYLCSVYKSKNPVITLTTFGSASLDPQIAMSFLPVSGDYIPCLFEIVIPDNYIVEENVSWNAIHAFADISSLSGMPDEQDVLFSLLTHFCVRDIGDLIVQPDRQWRPITLELINPNKGHYAYNQLHFLKRIKNEKNPQHYVDILNVLKEVAEDEMKFNNMNWKKWWSTLEKQWGTEATRDQPRLLILYQCFTEHEDYSRKAVEMYKDILSSVPMITSNQSPFPEAFKSCHNLPAKQIALYELSLEQFCTNTNTRESINCLYNTGRTYEKIADKKRALKCYETALALDVSNESQRNDEMQRRIKNLKRLCEPDRIVNNERTVVVKDTHKESSRMNKVQQSSINRNIADRPSIARRLEQLAQYLVSLEEWYDAADSKIILRLPHENTSDLSVYDYRSYFLSAMERHISSSITPTDATNNIFLSLWRYKKYMNEWILFKALEKFLQPFKKRSECISKRILPRLERLIKKISVLVALCTVYICVREVRGKIIVSKVPFIDFTNTETKQLNFFDLRDEDLLHSLEGLGETSSVTEETSITIPDDERIIPITPAQFMESLE